jgi:hypothetical protein
MEEAEILALLETRLKAQEEELTARLTAKFNESIGGYAKKANADLERRLTASKAPKSEGSDATSDLAKQLEDLKIQLQAEKNQAAKMELENQLTRRVSTSGVISQSLLTKALKAEFEFEKDPDTLEWVAKKGDEFRNLDDAISHYLSTDEGKVLIPAPVAQGSSTTESSHRAPRATGNSGPTLEQIAQGLLNK